MAEAERVLLTASGADASTGGYSFRYNVNLNTEKLIGVEVVEYNIPITYSSFRSGVNNKFYWSEDDGFGNMTALNVTYPDSSPNINDFQTQLTSLMDNESTANGNGYQYTVSYDKSTFKVSITTNLHSIRIDDGATRMKLGFTDFTTNAGTRTSENIASLEPINNIQVHSNIGLGQYNARTESIDNIMLVIPIDKDPGRKLHREITNPFQMYANRLNSFYIEFRDIDRNPLPLNGGNWYILLRFTYSDTPRPKFRLDA